MGIDYDFKRSPGYVAGLMAVIAAVMILLYILDSGRDEKMPLYPFNYKWDTAILSLEGETYSLPSSEHIRFRQLKFHPASSKVRFSGEAVIIAGEREFAAGITEKPLKATFIKLPDGRKYVIKGNIKELFNWEKDHE